ncbi:Hypothetical protein NTJ_07693 [Nesidiocoris tenuis]|uniref:Lipocalin/cytosolic fatty-acid binding domain-containing protein n=1 Tax=Nesidiocoris tenuis TaxID=355587 RepID=A0ABN7ARQ2_9HEMI|nr:Hypothetical protein NTJ_07693 [Nesidiocoris tenuis]
MFLRIISLLALCAIVSSSTSTSDPVCTNANRDVDGIAGSTNAEVANYHHEWAIVSGFKADVHLTIFGFISLPLTVSLSAYNGMLQSLNSISRSGDFLECQHVDGNTLEGVLKYDRLTPTYDQMTVKFLNWEIEGQFIYEVEPSFNVYLVNGTSGCGVETFDLASSDKVNYRFVADSWKGDFLNTILHYALTYADSTPLLSITTDACHDIVTQFFAQIWCRTFE